MGPPLPGFEYLLDDPEELGRLLRLLKEFLSIMEKYGFFSSLKLTGVHFHGEVQEP